MSQEVRSGYLYIISLGELSINIKLHCIFSISLVLQYVRRTRKSNTSLKFHSFMFCGVVQQENVIRKGFLKGSLDGQGF